MLCRQLDPCQTPSLRGTHAAGQSGGRPDLKLSLRVAEPCSIVRPCPRIYEDEAGDFWTQGYSGDPMAIEGAPPPPSGETLHRLPRWLLLDLGRQLRDEGAL